MHSPLHSYSKKALATEENIWGITSKQQIMSKSKGENLDTHILKRRDLFDFQPNFSCFMSIIISTQLLKQLWSSSAGPSLFADDLRLDMYQNSTRNWRLFVTSARMYPFIYPWSFWWGPWQEDQGKIRVFLPPKALRWAKFQIKFERMPKQRMWTISE